MRDYVMPPARQFTNERIVEVPVEFPELSYGVAADVQHHECANEFDTDGPGQHHSCGDEPQPPRATERSVKTIHFIWKLTNISCKLELTNQAV